MELIRAKQRFVRIIRIYPLLAVGGLLLVYLLGGFSKKENGSISQGIATGLLYGLVTVVPIIVISIFFVFAVAEDRARVRNSITLNNLPEEDPFDLAHENMSGFKVVALTGQEPVFTGITGNTYKKDASAICKEFPDHVPPVSGCECGFYTFKERDDAEFELSINPGFFLIQVDLFGIGFAHKHGYRAESQRVNSLFFPRQCMLCKTLPARVFVKSYKIGYGVSAWWQWSVRCSFCSQRVKASDKLSINQMSQQLDVSIN